MTIREAIEKVADGRSLCEEEMMAAMESIMTGHATSAQISAFIVALRMKGETVEEITGAARVMRRRSARIPVEFAGPGEVLLDIVGTGGDGTMTFNVSTAVAFVVAGGGVKVAKHGNRSVSSLCGAADVLEWLGVSIDASPEHVGRQIRDMGIGFLFAPVFHSSMRHAARPRKEIGIRTVFNILGPLTNPAGAGRQLTGVYKRELVPVLARVLRRLGTDRAMVVHGLDGVDEISITAATEVSEVVDGEVRDYTLEPGAFGFPRYELADLKGGGPMENALILKGVIAGHENGAKRAMVLMNAGAAFCVAGVSRDMQEGIEYAKEVIDSGRALAKLEELIEAGKKQ